MLTECEKLRSLKYDNSPIVEVRSGLDLKDEQEVQLEDEIKVLMVQSILEEMLGAIHTNELEKNITIIMGENTLLINENKEIKSCLE